MKMTLTDRRLKALRGEQRLLDIWDARCPVSVCASLRPAARPSY